MSLAMKNTLLKNIPLRTLQLGREDLSFGFRTAPFWSIKRNYHRVFVTNFNVFIGWLNDGISIFVCNMAQRHKMNIGYSNSWVTNSKLLSIVKLLTFYIILFLMIKRLD